MDGKILASTAPFWEVIFGGTLRYFKDYRPKFLHRNFGFVFLGIGDFKPRVLPFCYDCIGR